MVYQAAFYVDYAEDLRRGFPNRLANWRTIVVFDVKWCKTEVMPGFRLPCRLNIWCDGKTVFCPKIARISLSM